jgi:hypothetical protein
MKRALLIIILFVLASGNAAIAQIKSNKTETLNNQSIIDLYKAGLDKDLIISKIQTSQTSFDVSTTALIALKKEKLDNDIIKAMVNKATSGSPSATVNTGQTSVGSLPQIDIIDQVYRYDKRTGNVIPLEKIQADQKTKIKAFGYGGATMSYVIQGEKSNVRLSSADSAVFVINTGGNPPEVALYKAEINKQTRQAATVKTKGVFNGALGSGGAVQSGNNTIVYNVVQLKPGIYQITAAGKLESGEYFFAGKPTMNTIAITVYAFGIDQ